MQFLRVLIQRAPFILDFAILKVIIALVEWLLGVRPHCKALCGLILLYSSHQPQEIGQCHVRNLLMSPLSSHHPSIVRWFYFHETIPSATIRNILMSSKQAR